MLYRFMFFLLTAFVLSSAACRTLPPPGEAHDVKVKPQKSGIVAISAALRPEDRAKAEQRMNAVCAPNPYKITEEGEVAAPAATPSPAKEWQISYVCANPTTQRK
jgi:hypothetical protein